MRMCLLIAGLVLFVGALASPAIVYRPDVRSNPKRSECAFAVQPNVACESFAFGGAGLSTCALMGSGMAGKSFVDKEKILEYCKGWDVPAAAVDYGAHVMLKGFLGVAVGIFAWFANPLMLFAVLLSTFNKRVVSLIASALAVALALQSYMFESVPFDESSMRSDNLNVVDHLGIGFYLWMTSLVAFFGYCFLAKGSDTALR